MIKPMQDRVLLKPIDNNEVSAGGIHIPATAVDRRFGTEGIVVSIGPEVTDVKVGDRVMYPRFSGHEMKWDGEKYLRIGARCLLGDESGHAPACR